MNLYKAIIRPHLEYASVVWSPSTITDQRRIEGVQRRATKLVSGVTEMSYPQRLQKLGIPSLQYRRLRADMLQVYKILHGIEESTQMYSFIWQMELELGGINSKY